MLASAAIRRRELLAAAAAGALAGRLPVARAEVTEPADLGVVEAAAALRRRRLSAEELTRACLARVEKRNGGEPTFDGAPDAINAWVRLYPELALRRARAADRRLARGHAPLLCGIPVGVKDLYAVRGLPLTASSRVLAHHVATRDSAVWARLSAAGMVLLGHTHTHEFGAGSTTDQVGNPWRVARSAGGSSGGSAAAVAAGMVPAATGTDTGGSLRFPAALCGLSTIKATRGVVSTKGMIPVARSLDHAGPLARTVADCAALLQTLSPGLPRLATHARSGRRPLTGLRVAITDRLDREELDPDVAEGFDRARRALERLGARVSHRAAPAATGLDDVGFDPILNTDLWAYHRRFAGPGGAVPACRRAADRGRGERRRARATPRRSGGGRMGPRSGPAGSPTSASIWCWSRPPRCRAHGAEPATRRDTRSCSRCSRLRRSGMPRASRSSRFPPGSAPATGCRWGSR